jgi:hypothetical protein
MDNVNYTTFTKPNEELNLLFSISYTNSDCIEYIKLLKSLLRKQNINNEDINSFETNTFKIIDLLVEGKEKKINIKWKYLFTKLYRERNMSTGKRNRIKTKLMLIMSHFFNKKDYKCSNSFSSNDNSLEEMEDFLNDNEDIGNEIDEDDLIPSNIYEKFENIKDNKNQITPLKSTYQKVNTLLTKCELNQEVKHVKNLVEESKERKKSKL